ncbi:hypothetical protein HYH02_010823 [Chlamydomonas schloesseri]|uniref:UspA domain-containing protein n=1 Tax=Chlamydomonas schloesseri TaxID=2026947 RepID=A0A835T404_9CHLO|nr:hypothetical protein HYH02_010823 [Chlamydomonas schloesseri]|eukprot:KAG2438368.1 hypothetical protein HYH02_010823 [Chlamydomonas schloesseri]
MDGFPKRHILISVDDSAASLKALDWALENVYRAGDEFHLFHVIPPGQYVVLSTDLGIEEVIEDDESTRKRVEDHARSILVDKFVPKLKAKDVPYQVELVRFATDNESIGAVICKRAEQLQAAAVVMAKHNKGAIKEFFVGSVCNYCTHHCKSPVLVMHCD